MINKKMIDETEWIGLEQGRGEWNSWRRGEIHRDQEEGRWRRHLPSPLLTLRCESVGIKED